MRMVALDTHILLGRQADNLFNTGTLPLVCRRLYCPSHQMFTAGRCVVDWTLGPCEGKGDGEPTQLWRLLDRFSTADVLIADRAYGCYFLLAELMQRGIDFVIRQHGARETGTGSFVAKPPFEKPRLEGCGEPSEPHRHGSTK